MQGKEGGDRLCRYLPAKRVFGAVGGVGWKEMRDLVSITVLTEVEGKVSLRDD